MFVRWQYRADRQRKIERDYWKATAHEYATLVESRRADGKPRQHHVAYLGAVLHESDQTPHYRACWWHHMTAKLDSLHNVLSPDDRRKVAASLAEKVPPVTAEEIRAYDIAYTEKQCAAHPSGMNQTLGTLVSAQNAAQNGHYRRTQAYDFLYFFCWVGGGQVSENRTVGGSSGSG